MAADTPSARPARHRPRTATVFAAAFVAGAVAAVGVNRVLDVHLAQAKPQVECEPIFVALRSLPSGVPVTVWDVALRDWPKAMLPVTALRVTDSFEGRLLKFPLREGQPLISTQLIQPDVATPAAPETPVTQPPAHEELVEEAFVPPVPAPAPIAEETPDRGLDAQKTVSTEPGVAAEPLGTDPDADSVSSDATDASPPVASTSAAATAAVVEEAMIAVTPEPASQEPTPSLTTVVESTPQPAAEPAMLPSSADDRFDAALDMPSRPTVDLSDIPSVMARSDAAAPTSESGQEGPRVRYLVVPERIARQADTSFTTPTAPETAAVAKAAAEPDSEPTSAVMPAPAAAATQPPAVRQPAAGQPRRPSTAGQPKGRSQGQPQGRQQASAKQQAKPRAPTQTEPSTQQGDEGRPSPGPRAWGGLFPNVSAGLEAMGSWRSEGRAAAGQSGAGSTTR